MVLGRLPFSSAAGIAHPPLLHLEPPSCAPHAPGLPHAHAHAHAHAHGVHLASLAAAASSASSASGCIATPGTMFTRSRRSSVSSLDGGTGDPPGSPCTSLTGTPRYGSNSSMQPPPLAPLAPVTVNSVGLHNAPLGLPILVAPSSRGMTLASTPGRSALFLDS